MRKKRLYWLAIVLAVLITKATSSTSDGEDDDMDDDIYADVQVNADLLNRLLELISNSSTSTTSTTTDRPSIKLLIDRSSIQQQQQRPVSLLKLPVILASLNEQSRKLFTNFKVFFIVLLTVLVVLISLTMILILANFMVNKRALCRPATLSRAKKKSTLSFDIIDNGYRQSRPNGLIGNVVSGNNGGIGRFFHRSISTQSNLVVDHDYHFEDFSSFNRTYERINLSSTSNNTTTPTNQAVAVAAPQTTTTTTSAVNHQTSNNTTTNNSQPNKIDELDNFYELPYIDASSTYDFKPVSSSSQESQTNSSCAVAKTPTQLKSSFALLSRQESLKFKTFSSRRFTPNNNEYSNYSNSKQLNNNKTIYPQ